ncbi:MAG: hypothetical protein AAF907_06635, partial [Planctomycetota bacterium]
PSFQAEDPQERQTAPSAEEARSAGDEDEEEFLPTDLQMPEADEPGPTAPAMNGSAEAPVQLVTADLIYGGMTRTRVSNRVGRTRIARFRHRPLPGRPAGGDVQVATK